jgi:hypothetical protein
MRALKMKAVQENKRFSKAAEDALFTQLEDTVGRYRGVADRL